MKILLRPLFITAALSLSACTKEEAPTDTVKEAVAAFSRSDSTVIWEKLPPTYQADINNGIRRIGARLDGEMVTAVVDFLKFVAERLEANRAKLLESQDLQRLSADSAVREAVFDSSIALVRTLTSGQISSTEKMKQFDGGTFLAEFSAAAAHFSNTAAKLNPDGRMAKQRTLLAKAKVTLISESADAATVELEIPEKPKQRIELVKVEKRWIPKDLKDNWHTVTTALSKAETQVDELNKMKPRIVPALMLGRGLVDSAIASGEIAPLGVSQFTRHIANAINAHPAPGIPE